MQSGLLRLCTRNVKKIIGHWWDIVFFCKCLSGKAIAKYPDQTDCLTIEKHNWYANIFHIFTLADVAKLSRIIYSFKRWLLVEFVQSANEEYKDQILKV
jgi:hypothetical protein